MPRPTRAAAPTRADVTQNSMREPSREGPEASPRVEHGA